MKNGNRWFLAALLAVMGLNAAPASAMNVVIDGEPCPLSVRSSLPPVFVEGESQEETEAAEGAEEGNEAQDVFEIQVTELEVYGYMQDDKIAVRTADGLVYVSREELSSKLPEVPVDDLPNGEGLETIKKGDKNDQVKALQTALADLGYLQGAADGEYGNGTARAVSAFQEAHRQEATGTADVYTQMLILMETSGLEDTLETVYPLNQTVEQKFAQILSMTDADLSAYLDPSWHLSYDVFEKFGTLDSRTALGTWSQESPEIDRIEIALSLKVVLSENAETGRLDVVPCLAAESRGAYRPYVQSAAFAGTGQVTEITEGKSRGSLEGAELLEFGYIPLTKEAADALAQEKPGVIRLQGKNRSYDISVDADWEKVAAFVSAGAWD